jgi:succinoglycan biosynthesis protein ExoI
MGMIGIKSAVAAGGRRAPRSARRVSAGARALGAALATLLMTHNAEAADPIIGQASVIDGDTIEIAGERVQLNSVDAPEEWQVCLDERGADYRCGKESPRPWKHSCRHPVRPAASLPEGIVMAASSERVSGPMART